MNRYKRSSYHFTNVCGCDACHWIAYDFFFFYIFVDYDVEPPKKTFHWNIFRKVDF